MHDPDQKYFILCVRMADSGTSRYSSKTDHDYNFPFQLFLSFEASKQIYLSGPPLKIKVWPYRFKPDLPSTTSPTTDCNDECPALLFMSLHLLITWEILTGEFVDRYKT